MLAILFTVLLPVLPILIRKSYSKDHKFSKGEILARYMIYGLIIIFFSSVMLAFLSDEDTSFWTKIDQSAEFSLKYICMVIMVALAASAAEWIYLSGRDKVKIDSQHLQSIKGLVFCRKYIFPYLLYALAALVIALNVSLMFDNVVWGDEAFSTGTAEANVYGILQIMYYWDNHPPLHYYWLKLFGELFGFTVPVFHLASLVPFFIGILLAVTVIRKKFGKVPAAFLVMISGLGPACLEYNLEIRMYSLAFMGVLGCFYCTYQVMSKGKKSSWTGLVLWALVAAYSHYYALVTVGIMMFFTAVAYWVKYRGRTWIKGLTAIVVFLIAYAPWMFFLFTATSNVSNNWWMTDLLGLDRSINMAIGNTGLQQVILPLWTVLIVVLLLAESGLIRTEVENTAEDADSEKGKAVPTAPGAVTIHIQSPSTRSWSDETYAVLIGALTITGTIAFAYVLSFIMGPVLAERYLYPLTAVTILMLVIGSSRVLTLLKQWGENLKICCMEGLGKAVLVLLLSLLLVLGLKNYTVYSAEVRFQQEKTQQTLEIIGEADRDAQLIPYGVKHLGWTVLSHYYPENEIINGTYEDATADSFWYFTAWHLSEEDLKALNAAGYSVTYHGENQIAVYPFVLYHMEKEKGAVGAVN